MAKYSDELKIKIINAYLENEGSFKDLSKKYGITDPTSVKKWIRIYDQRGLEGLRRRKTHQNYSVQFKLDVVHYYEMSGESYLNVAIKYGLSTPGILANWHQAFLKDGQEGLAKPKGRPSMSKKPKKTSKNKKQSREEELEQENELLRAELAFIKKLRASGADIPSRLLKQKPESSKNSGKDSD